MKLWPADAVERRAVAGLVPYARNARTHSEAQVAQIAGSIQEWGWTIPVLVDEAGGIIAGHGRVMAALKLGLTDVPVMVARGWSEAQKRAYVIADNKLAENADWDLDLLRVEMGDLATEGFELDLIGFGEAELADLLADRNEGLTDPDYTPPLGDRIVSRLGEVWALGAHRLVCGDATDPEAVAKALAGVVPHLMVTDPPYGVEYDPAWREDAARKGLIGFSPSALGAVQNDGRLDWSEAWALYPGDVAYVWHAGRHAAAVQVSVEAAGFEVRSQIIWAKSSFAISRGHYNWQHEPCWYAVRKGKTGHWIGSKSASTLWSIAHVKNETGHSTQKPVECMRRPIENNSSPGQAVYDPFVGSGTTIIAAEQSGRVCHAVELNPAYVDVTIRRWQAFTGQEATLDGRTFAEIEKDRADDHQGAVAEAHEAAEA